MVNDGHSEQQTGITQTDNKQCCRKKQTRYKSKMIHDCSIKLCLIYVTCQMNKR